MEAGGQQDVCRVCTRQYARYTCPRCRLRYCSKDCFQQHSQQCTESFFRDSAVTELRSTAATDEERQRMQEILRRVHESDDGGAAMAEALGMGSLTAHSVDAGRDGGTASGSDEDEVDDAVPLSAATLQRLLAAAQGEGSAGLEAALQQLDPHELREFERFVASGQASQLIERWQPWWYSPDAGRLQLTSRGTWPVKPLAEADTPADELGQQGGEQDGGGSAAASPVPEPPFEPVGPLRTATGRPASPLVRWRLLEALYAYALVLRLYNGEWATDAPGAAGLLLGAAPILGAQAAMEPAETGAEAVLQAVTRASAPGGPIAGDRKVANLILGDVAALAALGRAPVLCALADMQRLISSASAAVASQQQPKPSPAAAASAPTAHAPQQQARVQRPVRRPGSSTAQQRQQAGSTTGSSGGGGGGGRVDRELRKQLRLAGLHLSSFLLPWANEQPPGIFADVAQAAAEEWQRWRDNTQQVQDTGSVPPCAARLGAAPLPSASGTPQQSGKVRIVELASDVDEAAHSAPPGRNGAAAGSLGGTSTGDAES